MTTLDLLQMIVCAGLALACIWGMIRHKPAPRGAYALLLVPLSTVAITHALYFVSGDGPALTDGARQMLAVLMLVALVWAVAWNLRT